MKCEHTSNRFNLQNHGENLVFDTCYFMYVFETGNAIGSDNCITAPTSSIVVNVKDKGAKGDGVTDDTAAIRASVDQVTGTGGTVQVPKGTYMIDAITSIKLKSDMTLRLSMDAILKALPNAKEGYSIISITNASNINVIGGTLFGDRDEHSDTKGEWGMGIKLLGANNVVIEDLTTKNCWGDGFYIGAKSIHIKFCSVIADNNRRQGMSIISVDGMVVKNSIFRNTVGTAPQAGLDLEPNEGDAISNVQILNSKFIGNKGFGIQFFQGAKQSSINTVTIDSNEISNNLTGGIANINSSGHKITNNIIKDNLNYGVRIYQGAKNNTVKGNTLNGTNSLIDEDGGNSMLNNRLE